MIPWIVYCDIGKFDISSLKKVGLARIERIFQEKVKHRFRKKMAETFYEAVKRIDEQYKGDARRIWNDFPSSAELVCRFLHFKGAGVKIATMATNEKAVF